MVNVPLISNQTAKNQLDTSYPSHPLITNNMVATGSVGSNRQGACHGDSGGPLTTQDSQGKTKLIGIVSWGVPNCIGNSNSPSIYTKISNYKSWISEFASNYDISGPSTLCTQDVYNIVNLPSGATVTWQAGSGLTVTTSQNTATVLATGTGFSSWIKAQITIGSTSFSLPQKDIWVGKPVTSISGPQHLPNGGYATYSAYSNNLEDVSYQWTITPSVPFTANGPNMDVIFPYGNADYAIKLTSTNICGSSVTYHYVATGAYEPDRVYPNPSSDIVHINLQETADKTIASQFKTTDLVLGELYDYAGNMVTRVNIVNGRGSFSVKHLSKGAYILKININNRVENHRVIVK